MIASLPLLALPGGLLGVLLLILVIVLIVRLV